MTDRVRAGARGMLTAAGYTVVVRNAEWSECLVSSGTERWSGRGADEDAAVEDALHQMLPSRLGKELFAASLGADAVVAPGVEAPAEVPAAVAAQAEQPAEPPPAALTPAPTPPPGPKTVPPPRRNTVAVEPAAVAASAEIEEAALGEIQKLLESIDDQEAEFAVLASERQRLWLLVWMCWARVYEEELPSSDTVTRAVAKVARKLGDLAKAYWPGSVRALQLYATPADIGLARRRGERAPSTWREAADAANDALEQLTGSATAGVDEAGWADRELAEPRPADPGKLLPAVADQIEQIVIRGTSGLDEAGVRQLVLATRLLRWLRPWTTDPIVWGRAMGRVRAASAALGSEELRELVDPRHRPKRPWSQSSANGAGVARSAVAIPRPTLADPPVSRGELLAWLVGAFDAATTPELVVVLGARAAEILGMDENDLPTKDRRVRRRFRELIRALSPADVGTGDPVEPSEDLESDTGDGAAATASSLEVLGAKVRPHTAGKHALFVSNREDPELQKKLGEVLGLLLSWCDGSTRRVQAACERVANRRYDLVLSATGFQDHASDAMLAKAAHGTGVPFVRVNRGRPLACVRAIARELGVSASATQRAP